MVRAHLIHLPIHILEDLISAGAASRVILTRPPSSFFVGIAIKTNIRPRASCRPIPLPQRVAVLVENVLAEVRRKEVDAADDGDREVLTR